jgi:hypothetical protein
MVSGETCCGANTEKQTRKIRERKSDAPDRLGNMRAHLPLGRIIAQRVPAVHTLVSYTLVRGRNHGREPTLYVEHIEARCLPSVIGQCDLELPAGTHSRAHRWP